MSNENEWELEGGSQFEGDAWVFEEYTNKKHEKVQANGKEFVGEFVSKESGIGRNKSNLYTFKDSDGKIWKIWGNTVLDNRLSSAVENDLYKIVYIGTAESKKTGNTFKNFEVYHKKNEENQ